MILCDLLSLSVEFEAGVRRPSEEMPAVAALRMLAGLEAVARTSLAHRFAGAKTAALPGRVAIPPAPSSPSLWSTRSKTYRPALGDPSVIEALLKFRDEAPSIDAPAGPLKTQHASIETRSAPPRGVYAPGSPSESSGGGSARRTSGSSAAALPAPSPAPARAPKNQLAAQAEIHPAKLERLSAKDLERCFPFEPSSKLLRPRQ